MNKIFLSVEMVENIIDTKKGNIDSNMILSLMNNNKYKLTIAVRLLNGIQNNNDLSEMILQPKDLEARNYKLYSALTFSNEDNLLRNKGLFDDEIEANGKIYPIEVGYIGVKLPIKDNTNSKLVDIISVFKKEHREIINDIKSLIKFINSNELNFNKINTKLKNLFNIFTSHTEKENLFLYPKKFQDSKLAKINEFTTDEIRMAYKNFSKYYTKWHNKINLNNFNQFKAESNTITSEMLLRIKTEEKEIFNFCI